MKIIFSVCDLQVMGPCLDRTLHPLDLKLAPIRSIVYGVGSKFVILREGETRSALCDENLNHFTLSNEKISVLFEEI